MGLGTGYFSAPFYRCIFCVRPFRSAFENLSALGSLSVSRFLVINTADLGIFESHDNVKNGFILNIVGEVLSLITDICLYGMVPLVIAQRYYAASKPATALRIFALPAMIIIMAMDIALTAIEVSKAFLAISRYPQILKPILLLAVLFNSLRLPGGLRPADCRTRHV